MKKTPLFRKGDVIRTNPQKGFYGIAVVLDDGCELELSSGKYTYPMCHIAVTPLIFNYEIKLDDIDICSLKPLTFSVYFKRDDGVLLPWGNKLCIDIYTNRNKAQLPVIGNIDASFVWNEPLPFEASQNGFHFCGDISSSFGRTAYIQWCRENGID